MRISDWSSDVCSSDLRATSLPDFDQGADDVAHHVMQERIADDVDRDEFAHAAHVDATHFANRAWRLALRIAKGREVAFADQRLCGRVHRVGVDRLPPVRRPLARARPAFAVVWGPRPVYAFRC